MTSHTCPIYIRVSSADQVEGTSLDTQLRDCQDVAKRAGLASGKVFSDEGESAKTADRPKFLELLDYLDKHRPPAVIVWKLDRLARSTLDSAMFRSRLQRLGIRLVSATENLTDDPSGRFVADVLSAAAQYDNEIRAQRSKRSMKARAEAGGWVNAPPLGYVAARAQDGQPSLRPDPDRAHLVARLFQLVSEGTPQSIARETVTAEGLRTRSGRAINKQSVSMLLTSGVYAGWTRTALAGPRPHKGNWPPIVDQATWDRVQVRLRTKAFRRRSADDFPLRGLLSCGKCGRIMTASWAKGRSASHRYYHCHACGKTIIPAVKAEAEVESMLDAMAMQPQALAFLDRLVRDEAAKEYGPAKDAKAAAARALQVAEQRMDRLVEIRLTGKIDLKLYEKKYHEAETALLLARQAHAEADRDRIDLQAAFNAAQTLLRDPAAYWRAASTAEKHEIWPLLFQAPLTVGPKSNLPDSRLSGLNCLIWLPRLDHSQTASVVSWLEAAARILPAA